MATFVVAHGAWSAGWVWKKMRPLLRGFGHEIFTPTYTGLGERVHLANPDIDLETHIADMLGVLVFLQRLEMQYNNGRRRGKAFRDFLASYLPEPTSPGSDLAETDSAT